MYCDKCGGQIDPDSRFCRHCGAAQGSMTEQQTVVRPAPPEPVQPAQRPANATGRIVGIVLALILLVAVIGSFSKSPDAANAENKADQMADEMERQADNMEAMADAAAKPDTASGPWSYSTDEDKVRGASTFYARTVSTNRVQQDAPYDGGTSMAMTVRKHPRWGIDVFLTISEGQMMCPSYSGCSGMVRFDNAPAQRVRFTGPEDSSSEVVFVEGAKSFIAKLKKAKHVTIEKTLYQAGAPQFEFDVTGLKWDR